MGSRLGRELVWSWGPLALPGRQPKLDSLGRLAVRTEGGRRSDGSTLRPMVSSLWPLSAGGRERRGRDNVEAAGAGGCVRRIVSACRFGRFTMNVHGFAGGRILSSSMPELLYYASGGGHGHVLRGLALLSRLGSGLLVGPARLEPWATALGVRYASPPDEGEVDPDRLRRLREAWLGTLPRPDLLVVDVFPRGIVGELAGLVREVPRWLVTRWVPTAYYLHPPVREALERFEFVLWTEPPPPALASASTLPSVPRPTIASNGFGSSTGATSLVAPQDSTGPPSLVVPQGSTGPPGSSFLQFSSRQNAFPEKRPGGSSAFPTVRRSSSLSAQETCLGRNGFCASRTPWGRRSGSKRASSAQTWREWPEKPRRTLE